MFGWSRNEKMRKAQALQTLVENTHAEQKKIITGIKEKIDNADAIQDAGTRFLAYKDLTQAILQEKAEVEAQQLPGIGSIQGPIMITMATIFTGMLIATFVTFNPLFFFSSVPLAAAGGLVVEKITNQQQSKIDHKNTALFGTFFEEIDSLMTAINKKSEDILQKEMSSLASSASYQQLYMNYPQVKEYFTMIAAQKAALSQQDTQVPAVKKTALPKASND